MNPKREFGAILTFLGAFGALVSFLVISLDQYSFYYPASPTDGQTFFLLASLVVLIVGIARMISGKKDPPSDKSPSGSEPSGSRLSGDLVSRSGGTAAGRGAAKSDAPADRVSPETKISQTTLDEKYAAEHDSWICPVCETINPNDSSVCPVCGYSR